MIQYQLCGNNQTSTHKDIMLSDFEQPETGADTPFKIDWDY